MLYLFMPLTFFLGDVLRIILVVRFRSPIQQAGGATRGVNDENENASRHSEIANFRRSAMPNPPIA
mgnify:CR=1 FL=1